MANNDSRMVLTGLVGAGVVGAIVAGAGAMAVLSTTGGLSANSVGSIVSPQGTSIAPISMVDAARLGKQGAFGSTRALFDHMMALGSVDAWLNEQFATADSNYGDLIVRAVATNACSLPANAAYTGCTRDFQSSTPVAMEFYSHALSNKDQLRQRVAFALSELIVASDVEVHSTAGLASLNQIFLDNAFGNYRDILKAATLNAYMGDYLDMADSSKSAPNENYAREVMQLFSMGVNSLNLDGTIQRDAGGAPIPNYTADDVHSVARALTGWTYARLNGAAITDNVNIDYSKPMIKNPNNYDSTAKAFLGNSVPAGATQDASLDAVINTIFNQPSTAPYVSKFLIQQLVTSNPTGAYVQRVSLAFVNNGAGVRGDMKTVIRAILTDPEARNNGQIWGGGGKVKEPVLYALAIGRLIGATSDGYAFTTRDAGMGQQPFRAPSVFNFYPPDYPLPLGGGLISPPSKLMTTSTILARHNLAYDWLVNGDSRPEYAVQNLPYATGTQANWSYWESLGGDSAAIVENANFFMIDGQMSLTERVALLNAANAITNKDPVVQARKRAQTVLYILATSPQFQVDR